MALFDDATANFGLADVPPPQPGMMGDLYNLFFGSGQPFKSGDPTLDAMMQARNLPDPRGRPTLGPQPLGEGLLDLASAIAPNIVGGGPLGATTLTAGARGTAGGAASAAETVASALPTHDAQGVLLPGAAPDYSATAKFPHYAENYPETGPPTTKYNPDGTSYPSKELTPEAKAFAKERTRINNDMQQNGYIPYFDPAKRSYVDPGNYPPANVDTSTLIPTRQKTIDQYQAATGSPQASAGLAQRI